MYRYMFVLLDAAYYYYVYYYVIRDDIIHTYISTYVMTAARRDLPEDYGVDFRIGFEPVN